MAITKRNLVSVDVSSFATIAALETALAAAVTGLASGFFPQEIDGQSIKLSGGSFKTVLSMNVAKAPYLDWLSTTAVTFKAISMNASVSVAALDTAIQALIDTQEAASKFLMDRQILRMKIAGVLTDVMILLFSNGTEPTS